MKIADKTKKRIIKFKNIIKENSTILIVMQDNPDPDSIASAVAVRRLANGLKQAQCSIGCGGTIGRSENRGLVKYMGLNIRPMGEFDISRFDTIAMVDTQPGTGNNSLPKEINPSIVFDHHPVKKQSRSLAFTDIRKDYGSTSAILLEYMIAADIQPDVPLATALLYGIRSDTQDLGREAARADIEAIEYLYPIANKKMLSEIQRGKVPSEYFQMLSDAIKNAKVQGNSIVTSLGNIDNPDMIAEVADLLLRNDQTSWTLCSGLWRNKMYISVRTSQDGKPAGQVIKKVVGRKGTGGGHTLFAGGQVPLVKGTKTEQDKLVKYIQKRFLNAIGASNDKSSRLVQE
jgi:nanoRNase/pAp phosphatase (c-di-AMP/oligoRNAs hydrolase)